MFGYYPSEYDERLWEIAEAECERLEKERPKDLEYLKMYYGYSLHHFGFGMYLRNRYGNDFPKIERDYVGNEIMNRMTAILFPAFENNLGIISTVTFCSEFLNAECYLKYGDYLINMICWKDHFKIGDWSWTDPELEYFDSFERKAFADYFWERFKQEYEGFMSAAYEKILDYDNFRAAALKLGYSEDEILETRAISDEVFKEEQCCLPLEILFFKHPTAKSIECAMKLKSVFEWVAEFISRFIEYIPDYAKECREFVRLMTVVNGYTLTYFPKFITDCEIVRGAVESDPEAIRFADKSAVTYELVETAARNSKHVLIFDNEIMKQYNDDDHIVRLAIEANGGNIVHTSERIRNSYEFAEMALQNPHKHIGNSFFYCFSERLRDNKELAMLELSCNDIDIRHFSERLLDDDDIAERLYSMEFERRHMRHMSERIRKKYGIEIISKPSEDIDSLVKYFSGKND